MTIICGTDLSKPAHSASVIAARLSARLRQDLLLLHAVVPQPSDPIGIDFEPVRAAMAERLEQEAVDLRKLGANVIARAVIGWPEEEITRAAKEVDAGLIVMGALGHRRGAEWLIGNVAEHMALTTSVPLLLVRDPRPLESWIAGTETLHVLLAADFSPVSDVALGWLNTFARVGRVLKTAIEREAGLVVVGSDHAASSMDIVRHIDVNVVCIPLHAERNVGCAKPFISGAAEPPTVFLRREAAA